MYRRVVNAEMAQFNVYEKKERNEVIEGGDD